jgi:hypothetical protein
MNSNIVVGEKPEGQGEAKLHQNKNNVNQNRAFSSDLLCLGSWRLSKGTPL